MMRKKEPSKFFKGSLFTMLAGAATISYTKRLLFGNPPSAARKAAFWSILGGALLYNTFSDNIATVYEDFKESRSDARLETIRDLRQQNLEYERRIELKNDRIDLINENYSVQINNLENENEDLNNRILNMQSQIGGLEAEIEKEISNQNRVDNYNSVNANPICEPSTSNADRSNLNQVQNNYLNISNNISLNEIRNLESNYWYAAKEGETLEQIAKFVTGNEDNENVLRMYNGITFDSFIEGYPIKIPDQLAFNINALRTEEVPDFIEVDMSQGLTRAIRNNIPGFSKLSHINLNPKASRLINYNISLGNTSFNNPRDKIPQRMMIYVP